MKNDYSDIINLPHHVSKTRPQMPMSDRAAQFSPFAALTGYDDAVKETARLTDRKIELDEEQLQKLDRKFQRIIDAAAEHPEVTFTYFVQDEKKDGGRYVELTDTIRTVDEVNRLIITRSGAQISMDDVLNIDSALQKE